MQIIATDLIPERLALAREFGARRVLKIRNPKAEGRMNAETRNPNAAQPSQLPTPTSRRARDRLPTTDSAPQAMKPQLSAFIANLTQGRGLDAAVIAVPSDAVVREAQSLVRGGGQVLLFSHTRRGDQAALDLATVCVDEKDLIGSYSADFLLQDEVARLVFSRKLDVRQLITHRFPLEQTAAAVELASHPTAESLKVVVTQDSAAA
jgi:threonine dehydrogenase-like Zn-dependent dehydrogenase